MSEVASHPVAIEQNNRVTLRRSLMAAGAALLLAHAAPASADALPPSDPGGLEAPEVTRVITPHAVALGSEDDVAVASGNSIENNRSVAWARSMGSTWWRIIIHPTDVQKKGGWKKYDTSIVAAVKQHMKLDIAASLDGVSWTDASVKQYMTKIIQRYGMVTQEIEVGNEVNRETMLEPQAGLSQAQTYRHIYQTVQPMISAKGIKVLYGALSSGSDPIGYARAVADCPDQNKKPCEPLVMDNFAYHPYQLTSSPKNPIEDEPGLGSLQLIEQEIEEEFNNGMIETPAREEPKLALTESGWWAPLRGEKNNPKIPAKLKVRYLPDWQRRNYYRMGRVITCNDDQVEQDFTYGISTPSIYWPGSWDTGLIKPNGQPTGTYLTIRDFVRDHPECIQTQAD